MVLLRQFDMPALNPEHFDCDSNMRYKVRPHNHNDLDRAREWSRLRQSGDTLENRCHF